jgi:hypothetical protein
MATDVVSAHVPEMFVPSFFTGIIVKEFDAEISFTSDLAASERCGYGVWIL